VTTPAHRRVRVIFLGRVQGVGFRATTQRIADDHPVTGYVRNCPDGTVEMEAEGEQVTIDAFLTAIRDTFGSFIQHAQVTDIPTTGRESDFQIRY
jgi:acylphosphatase